MSMPKLIFDDWKSVEVDGYPSDGEWCMALWRTDDGGVEIFVGGYSEENKNFYANFGLGGAVLDQEHVFAWQPLYEYRFECCTDPETVELTPSYHGEQCQGNGKHPGIECQCDNCDHYLTCFPDWRELTEGE